MDYSRLKPDDVLTVYHGTPEFRIPELINGFDSTVPHHRSQGSMSGGPNQGYGGLYVTPDQQAARGFGGGAVLEIMTKAKLLHGTNWDGLTGRESGRDREHGDEFPRSFRPYLSKTLSQKREPQALLKGIVKPSQITRIWTRAAEGWREYTREEYLDGGPEFHVPYGTPLKMGKAPFSLHSPGISLDDWIRAVSGDEGPERTRERIERRVRGVVGYDGGDTERAERWLREMISQMPVNGTRPGPRAVESLVRQILSRYAAVTESFKSWLSLKENPVVDRIRKTLEIQRKRLETRYGKRRADTIVATALATGLIPIPGIQVASILALMGISEVGRMARRGKSGDEESRREAERVAEIARNELLEKI
jgi:hypothetical protein